VTGTEFIAQLAATLGVDPPDDATAEVLLDLAGVAAHASERIAAPLACWLVGRAGLDPPRALEIVRAVSPASG
jgi:hypothetical protein